MTTQANTQVTIQEPQKIPYEEVAEKATQTNTPVKRTAIKLNQQLREIEDLIEMSSKISPAKSDIQSVEEISYWEDDHKEN